MTALLGVKKAASKPSELEEPPVIVPPPVTPRQAHEQQPKPEPAARVKPPTLEPKAEPTAAGDTTSRLLEAKRRAREKKE